MTKEENIRFKIIYVLIKNKEPMRLSEIAKETGLLDHHVLYHLKFLKKHYVVVEVNDKSYTCQPFLIDEDVSEDLKSLMSVIVRMISREIELPEEINKDNRVISIIRNLEAFIRSYSAEMLQ